MRFSPGVRRHEHHTILREFPQQDVGQQLVLLVDEARGAGADRLQCLRDRKPVGGPVNGAGIEKLLQARHPNLKKLVEVRAGDAQKLHALEQRYSAVLGLFQYPLVELEERQLPVDVKLRNLEVDIIHG